MASRSSTISKMLKERQQGIFEREQEKEGRQHGETKEVSTGRQGQDKTTMYWNADTQQWQKQYIRLQPPTGKEQDDRLRIAANEQKRAKIEAQRDTGDIFPDLRGGEGDIPAPVIAQKEEAAKENQNWVQTPSPTWGMTDTDRVNKANVQIALNAADQNKKVSEIGGQEYVTDYQTAVRKAGGPWGDVEQYYGEDVLDSAGNRVRKSNVFTLDEDNNPMGVKTRRQRLAHDLKVQEAQNKTKPNLVQTPSPTWTVDQNKQQQQPESTKVNPQEGSVPSGTSFKPVALSPEYANSIFFDPENFAK